MDHMDRAPREHERGKGLVLYKSVFRPGNVVYRTMTKPEKVGTDTQHKL
jgi:hypothetical protein